MMDTDTDTEGSLSTEEDARAAYLSSIEDGERLKRDELAAYRRRLLLDAHLSQRQLAQILDCSQAMLSQMLYGKARSARLEHLFAKHFGLEREDCFVPWERGA